MSEPRAPYVNGKPAPWVTRIPARAHGVYVIRQRGAVVYVGESHTGRLRKTMLRHFQAWTPSGESRAGVTYDASTVTVAVHILASAKAAVDLQQRLIARHRPRDNTQLKPEKPQRWKRERKGLQAADILSWFTEEV